MKKLSFLLLFLILPIVFALLSDASQKTFLLKDGSLFKGELISFNEGVYTIRTSHLGEIQLKDADVQNISESSAPSTNDVSLKQQVGEIQGTITADAQLMKEIQDVVANEKIMELLSDPALINDIMSFDEEKIKSNRTINELIHHPEIQKLIEKVNKKVSEQE